MAKQIDKGSPFLYVGNKIVGIKNPDGSESFFRFTTDSIALADLSDVTITGATDGAALTYDGENEIWVNSNPT